MSFLDYFKGKKNKSASVAKERLQIIVAHERGQREQPDYLPQLQQELLEVIRKYVQISDDMVQVEVDRNESCSVLELNVTLPERPEPTLEMLKLTLWPLVSKAIVSPEPLVASTEEDPLASSRIPAASDHRAEPGT